MHHIKEYHSDMQPVWRGEALAVDCFDVDERGDLAIQWHRRTLIDGYRRWYGAAVLARRLPASSRLGPPFAVLAVFGREGEWRSHYTLDNATDWRWYRARVGDVWALYGPGLLLWRVDKRSRRELVERARFQDYDEGQVRRGWPREGEVDDLAYADALEYGLGMSAGRRPPIELAPWINPYGRRFVTTRAR